MNNSLHSKTMELLEKRPFSLRKVSEQSGLPYHWLKKYSEGKIKEASVNKVQSLYEFLSGRQLQV